MKAFSKSAMAALVLGFSLLALGQEIKQIYPFKGGVKAKPDKEVTKKDLAAVTPEGKFFSDGWTFVYYTDDGGGGYVQYSYIRMGYAAKQIIAHHVHYLPDGRMVYRKEILSAGDMKWDEKEPRLTMGKSFFSGFYPDFHVVCPLPGLKTDLTFHSLVPPWRPGTGPVHYVTPDGEWYDIVVFIPLARISGTIKVEGVEKKITGWGYADHNDQTIWFPTQVEELYALRSFGGKYAVQLLDYHSPAAFGHKRLSWLIVIKENQIIYATDKYELQPSNWAKEPGRGRKYPQTVKIIVNDPEMKLEGEIKCPRRLDVLDVRDQIPALLEATAGKLIRQPAYIRQKAEVTWKIKFSGKDEIVPAQGILEYTIVEKD